jgi:hypothetical protein
MPWVWEFPSSDWGADFIYTKESLELDTQSDVPIVGSGTVPTFTSRTSLKKFKQLHCPPMAHHTVVDDVWEDIILDFVPQDRIQFYPVRLIARGEVYDDFKWVIPFDRVECLDVDKSRFTVVDHNASPTIYIGLEKVVHRPNCMGNLHLARDIHDTSHLLVSEALKDALAATGEDSMFYRPEDLPLIGRKVEH